MTTHLTLSRNSLSGSQLARYYDENDQLGDPFKWQVSPLAALAEQTGVRDWTMRRIGKGAIPESDLRGIGEQTRVADWQARRYGKTAIPASSLRGLGRASDYRYTGLGAQRASRRWAVNPLAGTDYRYTGLGAQRWPVNPLGEQTHVQDWDMRRIGKAAIPASSLRGLESARLGFGDFGAIDSEISVRDAQIVARKLGACMVPDTSGVSRPLVVDGIYGPQTMRALTGIAALANPEIPASEKFAGINSQRTVRVWSAWWNTIAGLASDRIDTCEGGRASTAPPRAPAGEPDSGGGGGGGGTTMASIFSNPWLIGGAVVAALAVGYYLYSEEGGEYDLLPEEA